MADYLRKPLGRSLNDLAIKRAQDALQLTGKSLPCSVVQVISSGIVEIKFELNAAPFTLPNIVVPVFMSRYVRIPLQVGDTGCCIAADARLGGITGLGSGVADLTPPSNLGALQFCPLGNTAWAEVDLNAVVLTAPNGFVLQDDATQTTIVGTPSNLKLTRGGTSIELDGSEVKVTGTLIINGAPYLGHVHSGVQSGGSDTGPVSP